MKAKARIGSLAGALFRIIPLLGFACFMSQVIAWPAAATRLTGEKTREPANVEMDSMEVERIEFVTKDGKPALATPVITICVGDSVEFVNNWGGQVNVFSYSSVFRFDLGRFTPGESRTAGPFPKPGLVRIYDEIHGNVKGLINVVDCSEKNRSKSIEDGDKRLWEMLGKDDREYFEKVKRAAQEANKKPDSTGSDNLQRSDFPIKPAEKPVAIYTTDWQPGDEVSFSFTGTVYGPIDEKQTKDEYTGDIVGIVDSQGNKTEKPWSKVINYKVSQLATSVVASLMKPDRTVISTANIPVHPKGTTLPIQLPPKITGNTVAYPVQQVGQPYTIYSPGHRLSGDANKIKLVTTNKLDNAVTESNAVAASPHSALFDPQVKEPGSYKYTVIDEGRFEESFYISAVGVKLDTSRAYRTNQQGTLAIIVALPPQADAQQKLLSENFHVTTEMKTPNVLAFSNGQTVVDWLVQKYQITNNEARNEFSVRAGSPGAFTITARAKTQQCSNPSGARSLPVQADVDINELISLLRDPCDRLRLKLQVVRAAGALGALGNPLAAGSLLSDEMQLIRQLAECEENKAKGNAGGPETNPTPPTSPSPTPSPSESHNPLDDCGFFVRQHYLDFLNREPDPGGFSFWVNEISNILPDGTTVINDGNGGEKVYAPDGKLIGTRVDGKEQSKNRDGTPQKSWQPTDAVVNSPQWLEFVEKVAKAAHGFAKAADLWAKCLKAAAAAGKNGDEEEAKLLDGRSKKAEAVAQEARIIANREQRRADAVRKRQKGK